MRSPHCYRLMVLLLSILWLGGCGSSTGETLSQEALLAELKSGQTPLILDVRSPQEYRDGHIAGAVNIPHTQLPNRLNELAGFKNKKVVVYCKSGRRAGIAMETLTQAGFSHLLHLDGDMDGWRDNNRPIAH